ncbi:MAG: hypothetical protein J2P15_02500 [Micromonosporaceae bacterium]|nr:hypothetical protein [Micromonosporaceae bacterium]
MATPKATGGDLYHLWRVAYVHLPRIADVFYDATRLLAGGKSDEDAFQKDVPAYQRATDGNGMSGLVGPAWATLRDEIQQGFAQVGETVLEAAEGVRTAIEAYLKADGNASRNILSLYLADPANHDPHDPASNPPVRGSNEDPGIPLLPG